MKRFMQLSIGVLCLAITALIGFQLGARNAIAQKPADGGIAVPTIAVQGDHVYVMNQAGEVWVRSVDDASYPTKFKTGARSLGKIYGPEK